MRVEAEISEHTRALRDRLRRARKDLGLTQQQVADRICARLGIEKLTGAAVSEWERVNRQPAIDVMAAWARSVGLRLVVELDGAESARIPVLLNPRSADLARAIDLLSDDDRVLVESVVSRMDQHPEKNSTHG